MPESSRKKEATGHVPPLLPQVLTWLSTRSCCQDEQSPAPHRAQSGHSAGSLATALWLSIATVCCMHRAGLARGLFGAHSAPTVHDPSRTPTSPCPAGHPLPPVPAALLLGAASSFYRNQNKPSRNRAVLPSLLLPLLLLLHAHGCTILSEGLCPSSCWAGQGAPTAVRTGAGAITGVKKGLLKNINSYCCGIHRSNVGSVPPCWEPPLCTAVPGAVPGGESSAGNTACGPGDWDETGGGGEELHSSAYPGMGA